MWEIMNKVKTWKDKTVGSVKVNKKTYYVCEQCGRMLLRKVRAYGHTYCFKHYRQLKKYGKFLDDNPRTPMDRNEIHIVDEVSYIYLYDRYCNHIATGICDTEDLRRVWWVKWKLSASGYMVNSPKNRPNIHFSRAILKTDQFVDHINHNTLDNRKENLRVVTKSQNQMNSNYKGVTTLKNGKYFAHIKLHGKMLNLGVYHIEEEALLARWYGEVLLFKEYRYLKPKPIIPEDRDKQIREYVEKKVQRL